VYFIVHKRGEKGPHPDDVSNPAVRRAGADGWDKANGMGLKEAAHERRKVIRKMRFYGKRPELIAEARGIRRNMEKRING